MLNTTARDALLEHWAIWENGSIAQNAAKAATQNKLTPQTQTAQRLVLHGKLVSAECREVVAEAKIMVGEPRALQAAGSAQAMLAPKKVSLAKTDTKKIGVWLLVGAIGAFAAVLVWKR